jgi:hypothetical protein
MICILILFSVEFVVLPERDFAYFIPFSFELVGLTESGYTYFYLTVMNLCVYLKEVSHIYTSPHKQVEWYKTDITYFIPFSDELAGFSGSGFTYIYLSPNN